jgi:hypothetical protein
MKVYSLTNALLLWLRGREYAIESFGVKPILCTSLNRFTLSSLTYLLERHELPITTPSTLRDSRTLPQLTRSLSGTFPNPWRASSSGELNGEQGRFELSLPDRNSSRSATPQTLLLTNADRPRSRFLRRITSPSQSKSGTERTNQNCKGASPETSTSLEVLNSPSRRNPKNSSTFELPSHCHLERIPPPPQGTTPRFTEVQWRALVDCFMWLLNKDTILSTLETVLGHTLTDDRVQRRAVINACAINCRRASRGHSSVDKA